MEITYIYWIERKYHDEHWRSSHGETERGVSEVSGGLLCGYSSGVEHLRGRRRVIGSIIVWIIIGLVAGALAKLIMPGDDPGGIIVTILIGIAGAFVGGFLASLIGLAEGGLIWTIIIATVGAIILLAIYRMLVGGRRTARR
jgi:uncharacterized membrane protein YeaQ/YmgE (transglycosylase-associated protein family)